MPIKLQLRSGGGEKKKNYTHIPVSIYTVYFCKNTQTRSLCHQHAGSSHCLDLLLGLSAEELGLDDHRLLGQLAFAQDFVITLQSKAQVEIIILSDNTL